MARRFNQRVFGGVADAFAIHNAGVVVEDHAVEQLAVRAVGKVKLLLADALAVNENLLHRHFVLCKGARFIGADNRHTAQALHRLQILDNGVFLCHFLRAQRLHNGDDGAERLGNSGDGERHGVHQRVNNRLALPVMLPHGQHKHQHADDHDDHRKPAREFVEALLQRRLFILGCIHQGGDLADFGIHGGFGNHHHRPAVGHQTAGKDHVGAVAQRHLAADSLLGFVDVKRLARQGALIDLQGVIMQDPAVGNHHIARFQNENISRNHVLGVDLNFLSVAYRLR